MKNEPADHTEETKEDILGWICHTVFLLTGEEPYVEEIGTRNTTIISLKISKPKRGPLIGKGGNTIRSLMSLLRSISGRYRHSYELEVLE